MLRATKTVLKSGLAAALVLIAGCGQKAGSDGQATLRVGDQIGQLRLPLETAKQDVAFPYQVEWNTLIGGPKVAAAVTGGSVDIGVLGDTPTVFAHAAGSKLKVVGVVLREDPKASIIALAVRPGSSIKSVSDLRHKAVAYAQGTTTEYLLYRALATAHLGFKDIDPVFLGSDVGIAAFLGGDADAITLADPQLSSLIHDGKARIIATGGEPLTREATYIIATEQALDDPKKSAAIGDFLQRFSRALDWLNTHRDVQVASLATHFKVSPEVARLIANRTPSVVVPIDAAVRRAYQDQANAFLRIGTLRRPVDAADIFDDRYNTLITPSHTADKARAGMTKG